MHVKIHESLKVTVRVHVNKPLVRRFPTLSERKNIYIKQRFSPLVIKKKYCI